MDESGALGEALFHRFRDGVEHVLKAAEAGHAEDLRHAVLAQAVRLRVGRGFLKQGHAQQLRLVPRDGRLDERRAAARRRQLQLGLRLIF